MSIEASHDPAVKRQTLGNSFRIKQAAEKLFESLLPDTWLIREQHPDVHIDYVVETVVDGEPTGTYVAIQLKGISTKETARRFTVRMNTKHLRYYADKVKVPVFLVAADVQRKQAFWLFLQGYVESCISKEAFHRQSTFALHVPMEHSLEDLANFRRAIGLAEGFMRERYPGSLHAAFARRKEELNKLDPRIHIDVDFLDGREHLHVTPKEAVSGFINITPEKRKSVQQKLQKIVDRGGETLVPKGALRLEGSPVFEIINEVGTKGPLKFSYGNTIQCEVWLRDITNGGFSPIALPGCFRGGSRFVTFHTTASSSPLAMNVTLSADNLKNRKVFVLEVKLSYRKWANQPLRELAYFQPVLRLCEAARKQRPLHLEFRVEGNVVYAAEVAKFCAPPLAEASIVLSALEKAREWATKLSIHPKYPPSQKVAQRMLRGSVKLVRLLEGDVLKSDGEGMKLSGNYVGIVPKMDDRNRKYAPLTTGGHTRKFEFFGEEVTVGPLKCILTRAYMSKHAIDEAAQSTRITWTGGKKAIFSMQLELSGAASPLKNQTMQAG